MTCQELATAALERLPIVAVVINNGWLGMVRQWQELFYDERFAQTHLTHAVPDYAQLAEAYGCAGFTVESEDELEDALAAAFDGRPQRGRRRPLRPGGEVLPDGARRRRRRRRDRGARRAEVIAHDHAHDLGAAREQAGRARARLAALLAARLQHPEPRRRADRAARHLPPDAARRLQRALARADREADAQARERAARHRAQARRVGRARARADHRHRRRRTAAPSSSRSARSPARASPTSAATRSPSSSSAVPRRSRPSRSSSARTACGSSCAPARVGLRRPSAGDRTATSVRPSLKRRKREHTWPRSSRAGNVELLDGKVAVLGYGSQGHAHALNLARLGRRGRGRAARRQRLARRRRGGGPDGARRSPTPCAARSSSRSSCPTARSRRSTSRRSRRTSSRARRSCSRTASTSTTAGSRRRRATT